jgi:hypothetical protein
VGNHHPSALSPQSVERGGIDNSIIFSELETRLDPPSTIKSTNLSKWSSKDNLQGPTNYIPWKIRVTAHFEAMGLIRIIEGKIKFNEPWSEQSKREFLRDEAWAKAELIKTLSDEIVVSVMAKKTVQDIWETIVTTHEGKSYGYKINARKEFNNLRYEEDKNMREHINKLLVLSDRLTTLGQEVKEEEKVMQLLISLPDSWETFKAVHLMQEGNIPWSTLVTSTIAEYERRQTPGTSSLTKVDTTLATPVDANVAERRHYGHERDHRESTRPPRFRDRSSGTHHLALQPTKTLIRPTRKVQLLPSPWTHCKRMFPTEKTSRRETIL